MQWEKQEQCSVVKCLISGNIMLAWACGCEEDNFQNKIKPEVVEPRNIFSNSKQIQPVPSMSYIL